MKWQRQDEKFELTVEGIKAQLWYPSFVSLFGCSSGESGSSIYGKIEARGINMRVIIVYRFQGMSLVEYT